METVAPESRRVRLRWVLLAAFTLQSMLAVLILGGLAYRAGLESAEDALGRMRRQILATMRSKIMTNLQAAEQGCLLLASASQQSSLTFEDLDGMRVLLFDVLLLSPTIGYTAFGASDGQMITVGRTPEGGLFIDQALADHRFETWASDEQGQPTRRLSTAGTYFANERPWYLQATEQPGFSWTDLYVYHGRNELALDGVMAIHGPTGNLQGVVDVGFLLRQIDQVLRDARAQFPATVALVDTSGRLIATADGDALVARDTGELTRQAAARSQDPGVRAAGLWLESVDLTEGSTSGRASHAGTEYHTLAAPLGEGAPHDWILLIAVPQAVFSAHIVALERALIVAVLLALLSALALAFFLARRLERPVKSFIGTTQEIRKGNLEVSFPQVSVRELATLSEAMSDMVVGLKERDRMRDAFARYVSPRLVEQILSEPDALRPGGRFAQAVVLFTDLRGFTNLTERLGPKGTTELLNRYFSLMFEIIETYEGFVVDMIGDAILVVFGLTEALDDEPLTAARCAMEMQNAMGGLDLGDEIFLEMGAGLHMGEVIVGNIGSEQHIKYGVVGDPVNTAARIESLTVGGELLVSAEIVQACRGRLRVGPTREVPVKGKSEPLRVHSVEAITGEDGVNMDDALPGTFQVLDLKAMAYRLVGKVVDGDGRPVCVTGVEARFLEIRDARPWERYDVLRVDVEGPGELTKFYGQVRSCVRDGDVHVLHLRWTGALAPEALVEGHIRPWLFQEGVPGASRKDMT